MKLFKKTIIIMEGTKPSFHNNKTTNMLSYITTKKGSFGIPQRRTKWQMVITLSYHNNQWS